MKKMSLGGDHSRKTFILSGAPGHHKSSSYRWCCRCLAAKLRRLVDLSTGIGI